MALPHGAIQVIILGFAMMPLAVSVLVLRLWSRRMQRLPLQFNDVMAIIATIFAIGTVSACLTESFIGAVGMHIQEIIANKPWAIGVFLKVSTAGQVLWAAANTSVKLSILSLYTVIFPSKKFIYVCYTTMVIAVVYFLSVFLEAFVLCSPIGYNWDPTIPGGGCHNQILAYLIAAGTNLTIDAWVVALPMPIVFSLRMSLLKKFGVASMFGLGILICVFSLLRVISIVSWDLTDITYTTTDLAVYSILEPTLGVVNACLPTIKPALGRLSGKVSFSSGWTLSSLTSFKLVRPRKHLPALSNTDDLGFARLDDSIPLTDSNGGRGALEDPRGNSGIIITREWEISRPSKDVSNAGHHNLKP